MGVKKTWFSYFSACAGICFSGYLLFILLFNQTNLWDRLSGLFPFPFEELLYKWLFIALFLVAFCGLVIGISFIKKNITLKEYSEASFFKVLSIILFVLLLCYQFFLNYNEIFTVSGDLKELLAPDQLENINRAFLGTDFKIDGIDSLYIFIISFMLRVFGENYIVVPLFNAFIEILLLVFLYFTLKPSFGSVAGFSGTAFITVFQYLFDSFDVNSDRFGLCIFFFISMIVMNIVCAYGNEGEDEEKIKNFSNFKILYLFMIFILFALFYTALFFFKYNTFSYLEFDIAKVFDVANAGFIFYMIALLMAVNLYISHFFEKEDHVSALTWIMVVSGYFVINNDFYKYSGIFFMLSLVMLSINGIMSFLFRGYREPEFNAVFDSVEFFTGKPEIEEASPEPEEASEPAEGVSEKENVLIEAPLFETLAEEEIIIEEEPAPIAKPRVELIENPLPGPKPHVKKNLDYGFEPSEGDMKYDYDVKDDDDFDI